MGNKKNMIGTNGTFEALTPRLIIGVGVTVMLIVVVIWGLVELAKTLL